MSSSKTKWRFFGKSSKQYVKIRKTTSETSDEEQPAAEHKLSTKDTEPMEKPTPSEGGATSSTSDYKSPILDESVKTVTFSDHYVMPQEAVVLGEGSTSSVRICINKHTGDRLACKMISKQKLSSPQERHRVLNEVKMLSFASRGHPHVVNLIDVCEGEEFVYVIMELCRGGTLLQLLHREVTSDGIPEAKAAEIIASVAEVLSFCHKNGIVHRGMLENILLDDHYPQNKSASVKVADFGNSFHITSADHVRTQFSGAIGYIAPEILRKESYGPPIDIWSLEVVLCNLLTGEMPYWCQDYKKFIENSATINFDRNKNWKAISLDARSLIRGMLQSNPAQRLNVDEILKVAVYDMLASWNKTGTNASALLASWPNNFTHPCMTTLVRKWYLCRDPAQIGNFSSYEHKLYNMNLLYGRNQSGDVELVGGLPEAILKLANLKYLRIDGHPRLIGPLPTNMIKSFPSMTSLSLTNTKLNGTITASPTPFLHINELDLSGNAFTGTPFCQDKASNFTVRNLNFSANQFSGTYCGDDSSSELELLDISSNQFTDINISILGQSDNIFPLKIIYAQNNRLQHFPDNFLFLPQLEEIYLDSNNLSGDLAFPEVSITTSSLRVVSLLNNNITSLTPSKKSPSLSDASSLQISDLVFLGGNPICMDSRKSDLLRMVCRFNKSSPLEDPYNGSSNKAEIIVACLGGVAFVALLVALFFFRKLMKKIAIIRKFQDGKQNVVLPQSHNGHTNRRVG